MMQKIINKWCEHLEKHEAIYTKVIMPISWIISLLVLAWGGLHLTGLFIDPYVLP
jgi:hypothetical protein